MPKIEIPLLLNDQTYSIEPDTVAGGNIISTKVWESIGKPKLGTTNVSYHSATNHSIEIIGSCCLNVAVPNSAVTSKLIFSVTTLPKLNILGREGIKKLNISLDDILYRNNRTISRVYTKDFKAECKKVCADFPNLFKNELGVLKDVELEVQFEPNATPLYQKPRSVPFALLDDLNKCYDAGIRCGKWTPVQFNDWGTPVVPVRKTPLPGNTAGECSHATAWG